MKKLIIIFFTLLITVSFANSVTLRDFTKEDKDKLDAIEAQAEVNPALPTQEQAEDLTSETEYSWNPVSIVYLVAEWISDNAGTLFTVDDAPSDGTGYVRKDGAWAEESGGAGTGDMLEATYDPTSVADDAFDMDNMAEGTTNLILTAQERANIAANSLKETEADSGTNTGDQTASTVSVEASGFDGNLATSDDTVQEVAQKVDDLVLSGGSGDVTGPASAVNNDFAAFDGTTGKLIKTSGFNEYSFLTGVSSSYVENMMTWGDAGTFPKSDGENGLVMGSETDPVFTGSEAYAFASADYEHAFDYGTETGEIDAADIPINDTNELTDETTVEGWLDKLATWAAGLSISDLWDFDSADLTGSFVSNLIIGDANSPTTSGEIGYDGSNIEVGNGTGTDVFIPEGEDNSYETADSAITKSDEEETILVPWAFGSFPTTPSSAPTENYQVANKKYVDDNAGAGGITWNTASTTEDTQGVEKIGYIIDASANDIDITMPATGNTMGFFSAFEFGTYTLLFTPTDGDYCYGTSDPFEVTTEGLGGIWIKNSLDDWRLKIWSIDDYDLPVSADTTAPTFESATVGTDGETVTVVFSENLNDSALTGTEFNIDSDGAGGADNVLTYSSGDGTGTWVFAATTTIESGETCNLDFDADANDAEDDSGNDLADFSDESVTNNSIQGSCDTQVIYNYGTAGSDRIIGGTTGTYFTGGFLAFSENTDICKMTFEMSLDAGSISGKTFKCWIAQRSTDDINLTTIHYSDEVTGLDAWSNTDVPFDFGTAVSVTTDTDTWCGGITMSEVDGSNNATINLILNGDSAIYGASWALDGTNSASGSYDPIMGLYEQ